MNSVIKDLSRVRPVRICPGCNSNAKSHCYKIPKNTVIYIAFCSHQEQNKLFTMFSHPEAPKSSQNDGIYAAFAKTTKASVEKTPLFATPSQSNMSEMVNLTVFLDHLLRNTGIYSVLRKHRHKTPYIRTNSKITCSMANQNKQKHGFLQRFCAMLLLDRFWLLKPPKTKRAGSSRPFCR